jgi:sarcosine oxidase
MEPRIAVIGAGIVGLSTAHALTERGENVRVYESGAPGNGQSGGESRIFRHAHDDRRLVELAKRSRAIWREWESDFGVELVSGDGVVALGDGALDRLEVINGVGGVDAEEVGSEELRKRMPLLADYSGTVVLDRDGGSIRTTAAIRAITGRLGDAIVADEAISLRPVDGGGVEIRAGGRCEEYAAVIVCAGRGSAALARTVGLSLPVDLAAHLRITFDVRSEPPEVLACLQDSSGEFPETGVYAAPEPGNGRYAVGLSETIAVSEDGAVVDPGSLQSLTRRTIDYVAEALPGLDPEPREFRHCWVTELPWSDDGVGVWEHEGVHFVAGHNLFKMAPALGRELAAAATGGDMTADLRPESKLGEP